MEHRLSSTNTHYAPRSDVPVLVSQTVSSCYPSDWDKSIPESRLNFSPAVCPSGMIYHQMGDGFDLWDSSFDDNFHAVKNARTPNQCVRTSPEEPTTTTKGSRSQNSITSADITTTIMVHEAWMLTWAASDRSTLSPNLPDLTNGTTLPTWVPGDKIPDGEYDDTSSREKKSAQRDNHLILTVGLVGGAALFLIVDGLMICCMCTTDERKKNKRETETSRIRMVRVLNARPQN
ncbi:hypothetical protein ONS95_013475 [Cadophora gregata]|uniref:uncharacterized protein n=1 Tax=Cadophora gregata TaxID=51156 RepID=UPI0026DBB683|nr:uncharacterized protein ONS95_013475 [Cadophora gregata]KAK0116460.1 hypothetical protein ONS95_013475 [Cadophora gregata]